MQLMTVHPHVSDRVQLAQQVAHQFRSSGRGHLREVKVQEQRGTVILSGYVPSFYLKQLAQELAGSVQGVQGIRNETIVCTS